MLKIPKPSFSSKIGYSRSEILICIIFISVSTLLSLRGLSYIESEIRQSSGQSLQAVSLTLQEAMHFWAATKIEEVKLLAADEAIISAAQSLQQVDDIDALKNDPWQNMLRQHISQSIRLNEYQGFFIISPDNLNLASMRDENIGLVNLIATQRGRLLRRVLSGESLLIPPIVSDVQLNNKVIGNNVLDATMFVATPIKDQNGSIKGALTLRIDPLGEFSKLMQHGRIGLTGESYAFGKQGRLLTQSRFERELRELGLLQVKQSSILNVTIASQVTQVSELEPSGWQQGLILEQARLNGQGMNVDGYLDYRGKRVLGMWVWDDSLGMGLVSEIDESEALSTYFLIEKLVLAGTFLTGLLLTLMTLYLTSQRMFALKQLKDNQDSLEIKIQERTENLLKVNETLNEQIVERVRVEEKLKSVNLELAEKHQLLEKMATKDGLTGLDNRRKFDEVLFAEWSRCKRLNFPISLLLIDVDNFKRFNDALGHQAGDDCLRQVAAVLNDDAYAKRPGDQVARYGGEEFVMVLSNAPLDHALMVAESVRKRILDKGIYHPENRGVEHKIVTVSIGVATLIPPLGKTPELLVELADKSLYKAKEEGRNRVHTGAI